MKMLKYIVGALFAVVLVGKVLRPSAPKVTAATLVQEINKQVTLPHDLGDGFRLDSVTASGNDVVSTVTVTTMAAGTTDPRLADVLATASKSDTCREIASTRQAYVTAGIRIVKTFKDNGGNEIASVIVNPSECT